MLSGLAGKVAVVTGGAGGIGSATTGRADMVRPSGGAGAWDFAALDARTYGGED